MFAGFARRQVEATRSRRRIVDQHAPCAAFTLAVLHSKKTTPFQIATVKIKLDDAVWSRRWCWDGSTFSYLTRTAPRGFFRAAKVQAVLR